MKNMNDIMIDWLRVIAMWSGLVYLGWYILIAGKSVGGPIMFAVWFFVAIIVGMFASHVIQRVAMSLRGKKE